MRGVSSDIISRFVSIKPIGGVWFRISTIPMGGVWSKIVSILLSLLITHSQHHAQHHYQQHYQYQPHQQCQHHQHHYTDYQILFFNSTNLARSILCILLVGPADNYLLGFLFHPYSSGPHQNTDASSLFRYCL